MNKKETSDVMLQRLIHSHTNEWRQGIRTKIIEWRRGIRFGDFDVITEAAKALVPSRRELLEILCEEFSTFCGYSKPSPRDYGDVITKTMSFKVVSLEGWTSRSPRMLVPRCTEEWGDGTVGLHEVYITALARWGRSLSCRVSGRRLWMAAVKHHRKVQVVSLYGYAENLTEDILILCQHK